MNKFLFVSHNATRTGAPIVLYNLIKWIKENKQDKVEVWFLEGGEMVEEFERLCHCRILHKNQRNRLVTISKRVINRLSGQNIFLKKKLKRIEQFDTVIFNTINSLKIIPFIDDRKKKFWISYLHEQPLSLNNYFDDCLTERTLNLLDHFVVVSSKAKEYLQNDRQISIEKISLLPPFTDINKLLKSLGENIKDPKEYFIVGACGLQYWQKGPDLFLQLAALIKKKHPHLPIKFIWVGDKSSMTNELEFELAQMKLYETVEFTGGTKQVVPIFKKFDLFVLTSRDESFSLVVLEACALKKPVICFSGVGDITTLVETIPENVVPYADIEAMAERVLFYYENRRYIIKDGELLSGKISKYDISVGAPLIYDEFKEKTKL